MEPIDSSPPDNQIKDIFSGTSSAEFIDRIESGQASPNGGMVAFDGSIDPNRNLSLIDPKETIEVYVRPNRTFSHVIDPGVLAGLPKDKFTIESIGGDFRATYLPGIKYRVSRLTLLQNAAVLCTPGEYYKILAQNRLPSSQNVQRQIEEMGRYQREQSALTLTDKQRQREAELRGAAMAEEKAAEVDDRQRVQAQQDHDRREGERQRATIDAQLAQMDAHALERHLQQLRDQSAALIARLGERGKVIEDELAREEEQIRLRWSQLQTQRAATRDAPAAGAAAPKAGVEERIAQLRGLLEKKLINQAEFDRQVALAIA